MNLGRLIPRMKKTLGVLLACLTLTVLAIMYTETEWDTKFKYQEYQQRRDSSIQIFLDYRYNEKLNSTSLPDRSCKQSLGKNVSDDLAKIDALHFPDIEQYIEDLFPPLVEDPIPPELPVVVTAFSSNHFDEGMFMLKHLKDVFGAKYKNLRVIVYDLGLNETQYKYVQESRSCEMRTFLFDSFPKHFLNLKNYAWKPIVIQSVAKEHPLVFWMDASVRFKTGNLDKLIRAVKRNGLMLDVVGPRVYETSSIAARTHKATFDFLHEDPCLYAHEGERQGGLVLIFANKLITRYILLPWVSCALSFGCMEPVDDSRRFLSCRQKNKQQKYHICHRFDQSVIGILLVRLFRREMANHAIDRKYFMICRWPGISAKCLYYKGYRNNIH